MSFANSDRALLWVAALLYLIGFIAGCIELARRPPGARSRVILRTLLAAGLVMQTAGMYLRGLAVGGCPLGNQFEIVQFVAWASMVLYFIVGPAFRLSLLGQFAAGYAGMLAFLSLLVPHWDAVHRHKIFGNNPWIELHAALAVFSYGAFGLLALTSVMHLLQSWSLKHKRLSGLFWFLPSVVQLDQINLRLLLAAEALLSISLGVGAAWWVRDTASVDMLKLTFTVAVWGAYLLAVLLRWRGVLHSTRLAWVCVALFAAALVSLDAVNASRHRPTVTLTPAG